MSDIGPLDWEHYKPYGIHVPNPYEQDGPDEEDARIGDVGLCIVCGEYWCVPSICTQCQRSMEHDRLERESGR